MTRRTKTIHEAIAALQRLSDLFAARREQIASEAGLSVAQWRVLEEIATEHFMPSMFAERRAISAAAVSKLIRGLLEAGLIRASIAEGDRRQRNYVLTAVGRRTLDRVRSTRQSAIDEVWSSIPVSELQNFVRFGNALADRLEHVLEE